MLKYLIVACTMLATAPAFGQAGCCNFDDGPASIYRPCDPDAHGTCRAIASRAGVILACARPYAGSARATHTMICRDGVCAYAAASDGDVPKVVKACRLDTWQDGD